MTKTIQQKIIDLLKPAAEGVSAADVRIGLGYTSVRLDNGSAGIAWTANSGSGSCTHHPGAGSLAGSSAAGLLEMLESPNPLYRTIGLAAANALATLLPGPETTPADAMELISINASDRVVMAGFFGPLIPGIRKTGCRLDILELDSKKPGTIPPEQGHALLAECSVAILTATSIVTGTIDELLSGLGSPRAAVILGPSSFMRPEVFKDTKVTHLAGAKVCDAAAVERIVSEGGGTMLLKKYMDFLTVCVK